MKKAIEVSIPSAAIAQCSCVMTTKVKPGLCVTCSSIVLICLLPINLSN